jgi:hypothetical protein
LTCTPGKRQALAATRAASSSDSLTLSGMDSKSLDSPSSFLNSFSSRGVMLTSFFSSAMVAFMSGILLGTSSSV